jgi:hypothetical protein
MKRNERKQSKHISKQRIQAIIGEKILMTAFMQEHERLRQKKRQNQNPQAINQS